MKTRFGKRHAAQPTAAALPHSLGCCPACCALRHALGHALAACCAAALRSLLFPCGMAALRPCNGISFLALMCALHPWAAWGHSSPCNTRLRLLAPSSAPFARSQRRALSTAPSISGIGFGSEVAFFGGVGTQAGSSAAPATVLAECPASVLLRCWRAALCKRGLSLLSSVLKAELAMCF